MIIGIPREIKPGENRVAMTPGNIQVWKQKGVDFLVESGAGIAAGFMDDQYEAVGATVRNDRAGIFAEADIIMQVQSIGANDVNGDDDLASIKAGQLIAGMMDPLGGPAVSQKLAGTNATAVAMELVPRISRAQSMDVLSSMATLAGYKAVLLGASHSPLIVPMLMTAAGTLNPMRVLIMGRA